MLIFCDDSYIRYESSEICAPLIANCSVDKNFASLVFIFLKSSIFKEFMFKISSVYLLKCKKYEVLKSRD